MHAHRERECVSLGAKLLRDALREERAEPLACVGGRGEQARKEVEKGVRAAVVVRAMCICPVFQDAVDPVKGLFEFAAAAVGVEKCEHVDADDGI